MSNRKQNPKPGGQPPKSNRRFHHTLYIKVNLCVVCFYVPYSRPQYSVELGQIWHVASLYPLDAQENFFSQRDCTLRWLAAWHSGERSSSMNEVNARRARLQLGWVTVFGRVYHLGL